MTKPNLLFVFADQMRGFDMGCAGNAEVHTPNLDRLAREGVVMERTFANVPVCTPSRAVMWSGLYPLRNRVLANDLPLPETLPTIGTHLKNAGYRTGYIGKWHLDGVPRDKWTPPGARRHGFDFWRVFNCSHRYFEAPIYGDSPDASTLVGYEPAAQTDLAIGFLSQRNDDAPFSLFVSWGPPHDPYPDVPPQFRALYDADKLTLRENVAPLKHETNDPATKLGPRETLANYYAAISALDHEVGRLLDFLDEHNLAASTLVVFTSDHGDALWSHGFLKKQQPWEEAIRIPFVARFSETIPAATRCETLFSTVDFTPTLLDALGISGGDFDGRSLLPSLRGETQNDEPVLLLELIATDEGLKQNIAAWRGVRTSCFTYARHLNHKPWLLFDNETDPFQMNNLVGDAALVARLDAVLDELLARGGDEELDWQELLQSQGLAELWNLRERELHGDAARLLPQP